jgi:type IV pilus assembly protein PilW
MEHIHIKKCKKNGFSMIELLISMAIFSIMSAAIYGIYISTSRASTVQNASAGAQQNVRGGLELMVQDIRMAGYNPAGINPNPSSIEITDSNKIRITSDRNENGSIDNTALERITYELANNQLSRILYEGTSSSSSNAIIDNVTNLQFLYSGTNNSIVDISLTVEENAGFGNTVSRTLQARVYCRNLDLN